MIMNVVPMNNLIVVTRFISKTLQMHAVSFCVIKDTVGNKR